MMRLLDWFDQEKRDLPWRDPDCGTWGVLVSEVMLQQTPVARVIPAFETWMARWPAPTDLAADSVAQAVRAWGRLGYPRRARRLHETATIITETHAGRVPADLDDLLALPGIGDYTARAIRCFALGIPEPVVDTNVRRVIARLVFGQALAGPPKLVFDRATTWGLVSGIEGDQARCVASAALMELGAIVCTARNPLCDACPVRFECAWRISGYPDYQGPLPAKQAKYEGSDRQVRGIILRELRSSDIPVPQEFLETLWPDRTQFLRALQSLELDGLIQASSEEPVAYQLPS
jgi:A/G-specific adenine glycosylase